MRQPHIVSVQESDVLPPRVPDARVLGGGDATVLLANATNPIRILSQAKVRIIR
jgi:hypothetical protein